MLSVGDSGEIMQEKAAWADIAGVDKNMKAGAGTQREGGRPERPAGGEALPQAGSISPAEFSALFEQSFRVLWFIALGLVHDRNLAEDAVQEAAIIALGKLEHFQRGTNFTAWMGQTVRYAALNLARRNRRHLVASTDPAVLDADPARSGPSSGCSDSPLRLAAGLHLPADQRALDDRVVEALDSISEPARACLLLRTLEGMEYREIARILDMAEGTAMSHVHRARAALRQRLTSPGAASLGCGKGGLSA